MLMDLIVQCQGEWVLFVACIWMEIGAQCEVFVYMKKLSLGRGNLGDSGQIFQGTRSSD